MWTSYTARRRSKAWGRAIGVVAAFLVAGLGISSLVAAVVVHWPHVSTSPTTAVVAKPLSRVDCDKGHPLVINIVWHGRSVRTENDGPNCGADYLRGQRLTVYVGSDSPSDVGPDANWILNPDTHDPFAFLGGPNDIRGSLYSFGGILLIGGSLSVLMMVRWARKPSWILSR
jgi:hypothetical protein